MTDAPNDNAPADGPIDSVEPVDPGTLVADETLVEEVSIDGMCGVY